MVRAVRGDDEAAATPILIVSARGSTLDRIAGLEDGADDYLPKPFSPAELVLRVKSILRRAAPATGDAATRPPLTLADLMIDLDRYEVTRDGRPIPLTRVEFRLLTTLIEADGRVLTRDQLLDAVYGQDGPTCSTGPSTCTSGGCATSSATMPTIAALRRDGPRHRLPAAGHDRGESAAGSRRRIALAALASAAARRGDRRHRRSRSSARRSSGR